MRRTSPYYPLKYRVDYYERFWATIAAFNSERIALLYADDCRKAHEGLPVEYRVMERRGGKWIEITNRQLLDWDEALNKYEKDNP